MTTTAEPASPTVDPPPPAGPITQPGVYILNVETGTWFRSGDERHDFWVPEQRYVALRSDGKTLLSDRVTGRSFEAPPGIVALRRPFDRGASLSDGVSTFASNEGFALIGRETDDYETCRVVRYDPGGTILSEASFGCALSWYGPYLSPDGSLIAANVLPKEGLGGPGEYERLTAISVFDAATGEELFRVNSAFWSGHHLRRDPETFWLPDSSGLVVTTAGGNRIVTAEGKWAPLPDTLRGTEFVPGLTEPLRFLLTYPTVAVLDEDGELVASVATEMDRHPEEPPDSFLVVSPWWGATSREVYVAVWYQGPTSFAALTAVLPPVIEHAPTEQRLLVRVATNGSCLNVREEPVTGSPTVTCLEEGSTVETVEYGTRVYKSAYWTEGLHTATSESGCPSWSCTWIYVRTDDGTEGWALSDYLAGGRGNLRQTRAARPPRGGRRGLRCGCGGSLR